MSRCFSVVDQSPNDLLWHTVDLSQIVLYFTLCFCLYLQIGDVKFVLTSLFRSCVNWAGFCTESVGLGVTLHWLSRVFISLCKVVFSFCKFGDSRSKHGHPFFNTRYTCLTPLSDTKRASKWSNLSWRITKFGPDKLQSILSIYVFVAALVISPSTNECQSFVFIIIVWIICFNFDQRNSHSKKRLGIYFNKRHIPCPVPLCIEQVMPYTVLPVWKYYFGGIL